MAKKKSTIDLSIFQNFSYEELKELISGLSTLREKKYPAYAAEQKTKSKIEEQKRHDKKVDFEKNILPLINKFVKEQLKIGTVIKVKGTRDRTGLREFMGFTERYKVITLECRQVFKTVNGQKSYGQITQHGSDKITHIFEGGNLTPIKNFLYVVKDKKAEFLAEIIEYDNFRGSEVLGTERFDSEKKRDNFIEKYNEKNNLTYVPDCYTIARKKD